MDTPAQPNQEQPPAAPATLPIPSDNTNTNIVLSDKTDTQPTSPDAPPFNLPDRIHDNITGRPSTYTKELACSILIDIATTNLPIHTITTKYGMESKGYYYWLMCNEDLLRCHNRALEYRTHAMAGDITHDLSNLEQYVGSDVHDPRDKHVRIQLFDKKWNRLAWLMGKFNRQQYGDKLDTTADIRVNVIGNREDAFSRYKARAVPAHAQVVDSTDLPVKLPDNAPNS